MVKFLIIISLLGFGFQGVGEKPDMSAPVKSMLSTYASEIANCDVNELNIGSLNDLKNICHSLVNSDLCSGVEPERLKDCDKLILQDNEYSFRSSLESQEKFDRMCSDIAKEQQEMTAESLESMAVLAGALVVRVSAAEVLTGEIEWTSEAIDSAKSAWNGVVAEAERLEEEEQVDPKMSIVKAAFIDPVVNDFKAQSCLNEGALVAEVCANYRQGLAGAVGTVGKIGGGFFGKFSKAYQEAKSRRSRNTLESAVVRRQPEQQLGEQSAGQGARRVAPQESKVNQGETGVTERLKALGQGTANVARKAGQATANAARTAGQATMDTARAAGRLVGRKGTQTTVTGTPPSLPSPSRVSPPNASPGTVPTTSRISPPPRTPRVNLNNIVNNSSVSRPMNTPARTTGQATAGAVQAQGRLVSRQQSKRIREEGDKIDQARQEISDLNAQNKVALQPQRLRELQQRLDKAKANDDTVGILRAEADITEITSRVEINNQRIQVLREKIGKSELTIKELGEKIATNPKTVPPNSSGTPRVNLNDIVNNPSASRVREVIQETQVSSPPPRPRIDQMIGRAQREVQLEQNNTGIGK